MIEEFGEENLLLLNYHHDDLWSYEQSEDRILWYFNLTQSWGSYPTTFFDGGEHYHYGDEDSVYDTYLNIVDSQMEISSPVIIDAYMGIVDREYFVTTWITLEEDLNPNDEIVVRMAVTEKNITLGEYHELTAVRLMLEEYSLDTFEAGQSIAINRGFSLENDWDQENISVVIFVQNDDASQEYPILQSAKADVNMVSDFSAYPKTGHAPLTVQFTDQSAGELPPNFWQWDFENDGIMDAQEPNPSWTYQEPGIYPVSFHPSNDSISLTQIKNEYIYVFDGESALLFDGYQTSAICPPSQDLNFIDDFTIEGWIKPYSWGPNSASGLGKIFDKAKVSLFLMDTLSTYNDSSMVLYMKHEDGSTCKVNSPPNSITLNEWHHIAATYDGVNQTQLYINGISQDLNVISSPSGSIQNNEDYDFIIGNNASGAFTFSGIIDEVRIWSDVRTTSEIQDNMNYKLYGNEDNLLAYWHMEEGNGETIFDGSGNGNDGVLNQAQWYFGKTLNPTKIVNDYKVTTPEKFTLSQNYPNPFNPTTTISITIPHSGGNTRWVKLQVYDVSGKLIKTLVDGPMEAGYHSVIWNGTDEKSNKVSSGIYFYRMKGNGIDETKSMILLK